MDLFKLTQQLRKKRVDPKIYAVVIKRAADGSSYLWQGIEYSLDGALSRARQNIAKSTKVNPLEWTIFLHGCESIKELVSKAIEISVDGVQTKKADKNALMQKIVDTKDVKLFNENKKKFNKQEIKLIKESLK